MPGICHLSLVPIRKEASHKSELVSQLLFGECFEQIEQNGDWLNIRCAHDNYEGWVHQSQQTTLTLPEFSELKRGKPFLTYDMVQLLINQNSIYSILLGSTLPWFWGNACRIGSNSYVFDGNAHLPDLSEGSKTIIEHAYMYLNAPYLWGGRSPFGIDCSGLTQMAFKLCGIYIKRDAWMQAEQGSTVHLLDEALPGDLAFFDNEEGNITHVGILTAKNKIIHASGSVRVDSIDHHGIFNSQTKKYTHNLRLIKRMV